MSYTMVDRQHLTVKGRFRRMSAAIAEMERRLATKDLDCEVYDRTGMKLKVWITDLDGKPRVMYARSGRAT